MGHDFTPLGGYAQMRRWAGRAVPWGPEGQWSVTFGAGGEVVDHLADLIVDARRRVHDRYPAKAEPFAVTLGCVPWLTSDRIVDALLQAGPTCICVDKGSITSPAVQRLLADGAGVANFLIPALRYTGPADPEGNPPVVGPGSPSPEESGNVLEPIRVVGWRKAGRRERPVPHLKLAVICAAWRWDTDYGGYEDYLTPLVAWWGSANWTRGARRHLEMGAWTTDESFCGTALDFLVDLIRFSQAPTSDTAGPEPDLVDAEWDDIAFAEAYADYLEASESEDLADDLPDTGDPSPLSGPDPGPDEGDSGAPR